MNQGIIGSTIWDNIRNKGNILYGARATNIYLPPHLDADTRDFDIYSKTPKKSAKELERELDRKFGGDYFEVKPAEHKGTFKVVSKVTGSGVADFTKQEKGVAYKISLDRIRYANLQHIKKKLMAILKDPSKKFRHQKDRETLQRIKVYERFYKW